MDRKPLLDGRTIQALYDIGGDVIYARIVARAQALTWSNSGHLIALNDEYINRRLREQRHSGRIPDLRLRCLFCMAATSLDNWARSCEWTDTIRAAELSVYAERHSKANLKWLQPCDGENQARVMLNMLDVMCD